MVKVSVILKRSTWNEPGGVPSVSSQFDGIAEVWATAPTTAGVDWLRPPTQK